ncbi:GNAT family N-acetyltransferase [Streptomyces sp. NBC_00094]|uniref:GNAT family N-acetyltransferase n=1 Tax=Streptomyces sp. NBC_00094 TaxID=2903620 RepID=UPI002259802C|nr:GNAT family N-acetyltransferase [Streptomyces sp. NBC_00094]MCX5393649.1 GNAT family N-acetyltransferase [Streptomyces sp. NBC_00094]
MRGAAGPGRVQPLRPARHAARGAGAGRRGRGGGRPRRPARPALPPSAAPPAGRRRRGVRHLVDRREARRRGADTVRFIGARTEEGEVASWADLYLDPATGTARIEDLITSEAHLRRGHADAVLGTALRTAAAEGCGFRFLTADAADWPRHWYERRGFSVIGRSHCFERA